MIAFDTNILFYMVDAHDREKQRIARELIDRGMARRESVCIAWQVLGEFYNSTTIRKKLGAAEAMKLVWSFENTFLRLPSSDDAFPRAFEVVAAHGLQIWDAVLWANADAFGCKYLFSEDFQDGRQLGGVTFVNPFNPGNRVLLDAALPAVE